MPGEPAAPAAGYDAPLALLEACHDRVRRSLDLLRRLGERVAERRIDDAVRDAARDVLRYFDVAAPLHHEDEERHVFPRVLAAPDENGSHAAVRRLQREHVELRAQWAALRRPLAALAGGDDAAWDAAARADGERWAAAYAAHAELEETLVFPHAGRLLGESELRDAGVEMASRRGVTIAR